MPDRTTFKPAPIPPPETDRREDLRQLEHLLPVAFAFTLPYLPYWAIVALAVFAILHALFFSPRLVRVTTREDEALRRLSPGKLYYALGVLALVLIFRDQLYIAAGVWALLSVGDAASNFIGRRIGRHKLPYHASKSWQGLLSFTLLGGASAALLLWWNLPPEVTFSPQRILTCCLITALAAAIGESLPDVVDDNIAIVWIGALVLPLVLAVETPYPSPAADWIEILAVSSGAALVARLLGWVSTRGAVMGGLVALLIYTGAGRPAFLVLLTFVALGSLSTRLGFAHKKKLAIAQGREGERGVSNVLANGSVALVAALLSLWLDAPPLLRAAFTASLATAALDTVSTEIGQWLGRRPVNPLTLRAVQVGTPGAVSLEGTLAGWLAAGAVAAVAVLTGWMPWPALIIVWASAVAAGFYESICGSIFRSRMPHSDEALNLYSTLFGATAAAWAWSLWSAV
ncbi:MAG TPA: DUF92 domain-containing protein [Acidobacteriota bacterium]|nr:DUF92 domain-containing protein [Acidobacteriota bacterium]